MDDASTKRAVDANDEYEYAIAVTVIR